MEKIIAGVDLRIFGILLAGAVLGLVFVIPYTLTIQKPLLQKTPLPMPLEVLIPIQIATERPSSTQSLSLWAFLWQGRSGWERLCLRHG